MVHTAGRIAVGRAAEVIESRIGLLLPDHRIYDPFEVRKRLHVLRPSSIRTAEQIQGRRKAYSGFLLEFLHELVDFCHLGRRLVHLRERVGDLDLNSLRLLVKSHDLCRRLWLKAVQPVKELDQHFHGPLLRTFNCFMHFLPPSLLIRIIFGLEALLLERDRVVEEELRGVFEYLWNSVFRDVQREVCRGIGEQEGNVLGQGFGEESRECGECIVHARSDTRDGAIGEDENGSDRVNVVLNLSCNTLLVEFVLMNTTSIGQSRRIEDANLREMLHTLKPFTNTATYHYAIFTCKFVNTGRVGLTLVAKTALLVSVVEDFEVIAINRFADKDIGDEFQ